MTMKLVQRSPDKAFIDSWLWVPKAFLNAEGTRKSLTFLIAGEQSQTVRELRLWKESADHLLVPRALWRTSELPYPVVDCRPQTFHEVKFKSHIKLDHQVSSKGLVPTGLTLQQRAFDVLMDSPGGILQLSCGKGKTVVFLALVAAMRVPTLVVIDNTTLLEQWKAEVDKLLYVPGGVGLIQGKSNDWKKGLVLTTYDTLAARAATMSEEMRRWFGLICWDEAHHVSAPTYASGADLFYGKRVGLTATPQRIDGTHVIYEFHIGPVIFKDLTQTIKPRIYFKWTDIGIDLTNALANVRDKNQEIHLTKVYGHLGGLEQRLTMLTQDVHTALSHGRKKVLVLSNSVASVVNLATRLVRGPLAPLYSDIPVPVASDVGEVVQPMNLSKAERVKIQMKADELRTALVEDTLNPVKRDHWRLRLVELERTLEAVRVQDKIQNVLRARQLAFIRDLETVLGEHAGLMIADVKAKNRIWYARNSRVVFAIMKYGKEGLDAPDIDTIFIIDPFSQRNVLQQVMGRSTRPAVDKLEPVVVIYEDNVGPIINMCKKLRQHLSDWSHEDGGPFTYQLVGHPRARPWNPSRMFSATGQ